MAELVTDCGLLRLGLAGMEFLLTGDERLLGEELLFVGLVLGLPQILGLLGVHEGILEGGSGEGLGVVLDAGGGGLVEI
jgi:hypothetical protein